MLTLAVILAASGVYWDRSLHRSLLGHMDEKLLLVAENAKAFHLQDHQDRPAPHACRSLESFIRSRNWSQYVQFLSPQGDVSCYTGNLKGFFLPAGSEALSRARSGEPHFETIKLTEGQRIRLLSFPLSVDGELLDIIQVGDELDSIDQTLHQNRVLLLWFSPLLLLFLAVAGWLVTGRALSPVLRITSAVRKITAENLSERLPVEPSGDEIAHLQETFNSMLERLEVSFNKVRQFTGDASHELRTPLAILRGETEVALRFAKDPQEWRRTLESNMEEIDRMGRIIEDLLALAKSEAGEIPLALTDVNLNDLMQDLYLQGKTLGDQKDVAFTLQLLVDREISLRGDSLQLHRMLLNLVSNGIKYTPAGGAVELSLRVEGPMAIIKVVDNGIGIAEEHFPHLFDRFYRVDEARNRGIGGTGLGLSIVQWIARGHGGEVLVSSTPGEGSVFTVTLPLKGPGEHLARQ